MTSRLGRTRAIERTVIRFGAVVFAIAGALAAWSFRSIQATDVAVVRPNVEVTGATEELAMVRWAVERFEIAGLEPPVVEIAFHRGLPGCGGHLGLARQGEVDVCTALVDPIARRALLHEMGHIWLDQNLSDPERERFLEVRDLHAWNDSSDTWALRGYEQGAEIMAWALGERILTPRIPDNEPIQLARGFELLTGSAPPAYTDASNEQAPSTHKGVVRVWRTAPGSEWSSVAARSVVPQGRLLHPGVRSDPRGTRATGTRPPSIPDNRPEQLGAGFELLSGRLHGGGSPGVRSLFGGRLSRHSMLRLTKAATTSSSRWAT